jgi:hypothetical protein
MHSICNAYTHNLNILEIYCAYTMYIQSKFLCTYNLNLFDIHGICMVYIMHITSIYLLYDNNNLPGPCTLTHPVLAPGTPHQPAWTYGSCIFPTLLMYQGYQNQLHHERLARCRLSHEWAVRVAEECHETLKTRGTCYISNIYK